MFKRIAKYFGKDKVEEAVVPQDDQQESNDMQIAELLESYCEAFTEAALPAVALTQEAKEGLTAIDGRIGGDGVLLEGEADVPQDIQQESNDVQIAELLASYCEALNEAALPAVALTGEVKEGLTAIDSRIGGDGVLLEGEAWPSRNGTDLIFLMQINLAVDGGLEWLPDTGYLQFWIGNDDMYGCYDFPATQGGRNAFMVRYLPADASLVVVPGPELKDAYDSPFSGNPGAVCGLKGALVNQVPPPAATESFLKKDAYAVADSIVKLGGNENDVWVARDGGGNPWNAKAWLGGHPDYTQSDPRYGTIFDGYSVLATIDSARFGGVDIMWGDCGIATFYIKPEDARKGDFSSTLYYFDCC